MDIARPNLRKTRINALGFVVLFVLAMLGVCYGLYRLKPKLERSLGPIERPLVVNNPLGFKIIRAGDINGYTAYIIEDNAGNRFLTFRDNVIPLKEK